MEKSPEELQFRSAEEEGGEGRDRKAGPGEV